MSSKWSFTGSAGLVRPFGQLWRPIPVRDTPNDMRPKEVDRVKIKAARKTSRRNRRKR